MASETLVTTTAAGTTTLSHLKASKLTLTGGKIEINDETVKSDKINASFSITTPMMEVSSANVVYRFVIGDNDDLCIEKHQPNGVVTLLTMGS